MATVNDFLLFFLRAPLEELLEHYSQEQLVKIDNILRWMSKIGG